MGNLLSKHGDTCSGTGYSRQSIEGKIVKNVTYITNSTPGPDGKAAAANVGSCCSTIDGDNRKLCDVFETKLKQFYSKLALPKVAWTEKEEQKLSIEEYFIQLELNESKKKKPIAIDQVFSWVKNKPPRRILIEGQPGFGKTTLSIKLTHDWAMSKEYNNFKFVLLVPLRGLRQQNFEAAIKKIGDQCDSPDIVRIINNHRSKTLVILDGLDELKEENREEIIDILYRKKYGDVTVVAFCRTGLFRLINDERSRLFESYVMGDNFSDKRINTLGITSTEKKIEFLNKLLVPKDIIENIVETLSSQWELFDCPLLLMFLSILIEEGETIRDFASKTDLFKQLFNLILKQSLTKRGDSLDNDRDLFRLNSSLNSTQEQMKRFGLLAVKKIIENDLTFASDDSTREVYQLGFLIHHDETTCGNGKNVFEAFHLSILEFAAAFAIWTDLKLRNFGSVKSNLKLIVHHFIITGGTSLILPFVASLMEGELDLLLSLTDSYNAWFNFFVNLLVKLVSECSPINIHKSECLKNCITHFIYSTCYQGKEEMCKEMVEYGIKCGQIKLIEINKETKVEMFTNEIRTRLQITFDKYSDTKFLAYSTVPCKPTEMFSFPIPFQGPLNEWLRFAISSHCESCDLEFDTSKASSKFLQLIRDHEEFSKIKYRQLKIIISTEFEKQVVIKLLQNNRVEYLELTQRKRKKKTFFHNILRPKILDMRDFSIAAAQSRCLTYIRLIGFTIDLYDLTNGGTKQYSNLGLFGCTLTCKEPLSNRNCCHRLAIFYAHNAEVVVETEPSVFVPHPVAGIKNLIDKYPSWNGFKTVETLIVSCPDIVFINPFTNLKTLHLEVSESTDVDELAEWIRTLPIINLVISNYISSDISKLFKCMNNLWTDREKSKLKTISLVESGHHFEISHAYELLVGLSHKNWDKVNSRVGIRTNLDELMKCVSSLNLHVQTSYFESIYFEPDPFLNHLLTYDNGMLCITRK